MNDSERAGNDLLVVILLSLVFGVATLNRLSIIYLYPFIIEDFQINYTQAAAIGSVHAMAFSLSIWFFGNLSDRVGIKKLIIPGTIVFFLLAWISALTRSFYQMFVARGAMGLSQGTILPTSLAWIAKESKPSRRGLNFGIQTSLTPLVAMGLGPILVTQMSKTMSWQMIFFILGIPGFVIGIILYYTMWEPKVVSADKENEPSESPHEKPGFFEPLKYRNVVLSCFVGFLIISSVAVFITFGILYLTKEMKLSVEEAGQVIAMFGFTGCLGCILLPMLSDQIGRKPVALPSLFLIGLSIWGFILAGSNTVLLMVMVGAAGFIMGGVPPVALSALTTEGVPRHLVDTAASIPITIAEVLGAALMPVLAGRLSDLYSIKAALFMAAAAPILAGFFAPFYKETAPKVLAKKKAKMA